MILSLKSSPQGWRAWASGQVGTGFRCLVSVTDMLTPCPRGVTPTNVGAQRVNEMGDEEPLATAPWSVSGCPHCHLINPCDKPVP